MDFILSSPWTNTAIAILIVLITTTTIVTMGAFSSKNQMPVEGKTILITGASEGMGRSAAIQLAAKGAHIILVSRSAAKLEAALADVRAAARNPESQRFTYITADVSQADYAAPLLAEAVSWNEGRALDIVWCVAGTSAPDFWLETPLSLTRSQMDINYWGAAEMAHAVLRQWCAADAPVVPEAKHLILTSSVLAFFPVVGYGPYTPAKSALRGLADTLVQELEMYPQRVRLHVVYPASIGSPGFARENMTKPQVTKQIEEGDPVQTPDDVAAAAIRKLEQGQYFVTSAFLGHLMRWGALGGSPRNSWLLDTLMCCLMPIIWIFVLPDIYSKIRKYAKEHGHPATYRTKHIQDAKS
ncbi:short-chain dehydrogenase [Annulohypoxylon truncatum]|uniref:short-chain dehydrogenase n=1 Tax=Annulohypoxylon truncatum TaxID=327061 RepID=UPI002008A3D7|nr:short-chain dehydrogenase [Annulohypoxylon truncatum]KAI1212177.1 short-chain dehydrogenase [Annulohypoxylon truncatum]